MTDKLNSIKNELARLADIKQLKKEFDRIALPRLKRLFGQPRTVGKPRRGIKKSKGNHRSSAH